MIKMKKINFNIFLDTLMPADMEKVDLAQISEKVRMMMVTSWSVRADVYYLVRVGVEDAVKENAMDSVYNYMNFKKPNAKSEQE